MRSLSVICRIQSPSGVLYQRTGSSISRFCFSTKNALCTNVGSPFKQPMATIAS